MHATLFYGSAYTVVLQEDKEWKRDTEFINSIDMTKDQMKLEQFLNNLEGEVVAIIPNVNPKFTPGGMGAKVNFLLIVEKSKKD